MAGGRSIAGSEFARPLAALKSCHVRIRTQCASLRALAARMREVGPDAVTRRIAADLVQDFDATARHHHEDEEDDLLPRMIVVSTISRTSSLTRLVANVANEHREMERAWVALRAALSEVAAGQAGLDVLEVDHFVKLCVAHMAIEEANFYPLAELLLSRGDFAEIANGMTRRRARI